MASPFGDQDQSPGGAAKRPAQTIEGTATEVNVEPAPGEETHAESKEEPTGMDASQQTDDRQPASPPPPRPGRVKSFITHCLAGLIGGLIGVAALALAWSGLDLGGETKPAPAISALEQRVAKLEAAPSSSADPGTLSELKSRLAALEAGTKQSSSELTALADRVTQLETSLKTLAETASEGGSVASAAAIAQQIGEAEKQLEAKMAAALAKGEATNQSALQQMQKDIADLKAKLSALAEAELGGGGEPSDLAPELAALTARIAKIEATLPELAGAIDKDISGAKSAAIAIAFANLRAAVSDGRRYASELDTVSTLAPSVGDLGILPAYAETGIPTLSDLARSFVTARDNALTVSAAPPAGGSLVDSLMASAQSLVKIHRIDEQPTGEGPAATLARAKAALDQGDLASAVKNVEMLDGDTREAFSAWLGQANARLGADETLTRLEGILLVAVGGDAEMPQQ
jgi:hypothetical protein